LAFKVSSHIIRILFQRQSRAPPYKAPCGILLASDTRKYMHRF